MDGSRFRSGYDAETYVRSLRNYRALVRELMRVAEPRADHVQALRKAAGERPQPVRATMMTEDWCGDSAANTPILAHFFQAAGIKFRVFRGSETSDLKQMYEDDGDTHIPVVSLWDGEGRELGRWIEAPRAVQQKKDDWKAARPEFMDLYQRKGSDRTAAKEFASLYGEFLRTMGEWYKTGLWDETTREIVALL